MLELLARSLLIATRFNDISNKLATDRERRDLDEFFWRGRRWHQPEETRR